MIRHRIQNQITAALEAAKTERLLPQEFSTAFVLTETKSADHGDYSLNSAMTQAKALGTPPRELATKVAEAVAKAPDIERAEVAGPGFVNLFVAPTAIANSVESILESESEFGVPDMEAIRAPQRINVEFVSVNPNGPITVGSGRGAAFGDVLCKVLRMAGNQVDAEFYINDALNSEQMRLFAESVRFYLAEAEGKSTDFPEKGYKGDYVKAVAIRIAADAAADSTTPIHDLQAVVQSRMVEIQKTDLSGFRVDFDRWFSEQSLHEDGTVAKAIDALVNSGAADKRPQMSETVREGKTSTTVVTPQEPGPLWLRSQELGDDKDRVLVRSDGRPAYIAGDLAYLANKLGSSEIGGRNYDRAILIVGPDHHGYIGRMQAIQKALGFGPERFEIVMYQLVRFMKDGSPAPMRKRDGNIYELKDLYGEIGVDAARFFYLMRSHESPMDFDIDLATAQSDENPVFYVQYAHARICSVIAKSEALGIHYSKDKAYKVLGELRDPRELALIKKIADLPNEIERTAADYGVHRLTTYAIELARAFHHFYDGCRVVQPDQEATTMARLALCRAARLGLGKALEVLGVSAPERMDRPTEVDASQTTSV